MDDLKPINLDGVDNKLVEDIVMEPVKKPNMNPLIVMVAIFLGLGFGFFVAQNRLKSGSTGILAGSTPLELTSSTTIKVGDTFGSGDEKTFRDQAEGILMAGGIDGEGSHHIERGSNKTQWVYVTSSVVDLDLVVGDRVTIWGETNQGKKAGWLMDVGKLKVLQLNAATPTEASPAQD